MAPQTIAEHTPELSLQDRARIFEQLRNPRPQTNSEIWEMMADFAKEEQAELLEALEAIADAFYRESLVEHRGDVMPKVWAAIRKAKGE